MPGGTLTDGEDAMRPMEVLRNEHGLIRQYLDNLALAVEKVESDERPPREFFEKAVQFARAFPDGIHHFKEELVLFMRLAQKHGGEIDGQIESLRQQHEHARNHIAAIDAAIDGYAQEKPKATRELMENVSAYVALMRTHTHTEDHVFFPMAQEALTADEEEQIHQEFERAREKAGEDAFEQNHATLVEMGSMLTHL